MDRALPSERAVAAAPSSQQAVSPLRASIASAICKPFSVQGHDVTSAMIADAINLLANTPPHFIASDLVSAFWPDSDVSFHQKQEATNRLMQRWRKLGLAEFHRGWWCLTRGAWDRMQSAAAKAIEAGTAETGTGSVHESAVPTAFAQTQSEDTP